MSPEVPGQLDALDLVAEAVHLSTKPVDSPVGFGTNPRQTPPQEGGEDPPVSGRLPRLGADGQPPGAAEGKDAGDHA